MQDNTVSKINLLDYHREDLIRFFEAVGEKSYRAQQLLQWIHRYHVTDFDLMTNFSKKLREYLKENTYIEAPVIVFDQLSKDGTRKWLFQLKGGNCIETVFIPEPNRGTLCISSQVGCALNCSFCSTAQQGFNRNLTVGEIIAQLWLAKQRLMDQYTDRDHIITNVVLMGMGEPLLNFDAVVKAMDLMMDDFAYGLAKRRVTLSTSGVVPKILELAQVSSVALAVSLHAPNDELRDQLVPINKKYPIALLMEACKTYQEVNPHRKITMEYVMLRGVNDTTACARQLIQVLQGVSAKVNLIPFNPFPNTTYQCSTEATIDAFRTILQKAGVLTTIRKTRGNDIDAACGQLVGKVTKDRKRLAERLSVNSNGGAYNEAI